MNKISAFLDQICLHISCKAVHSEVRQELSEHIDELKDTYLSEGLNEDEALNKAIAAMGDADVIGTRLDKQHRPQIEWSLLLLTVLIALFGGAAMYFIGQDSGQIQFPRYLFFSGVGLAVLLSVTMFDYTKLFKLSWFFYAAVNLILILGLFGARINGSHRVVYFAGYGFSPAGLLHFTIIPLSVWLCRAERWSDFIKLFLLAALPMVLTALYPSMINILIFAVMLLVSAAVAVLKSNTLQNKKQYIFICCLFLLLAAVIGFFLMPEYLRAKLWAFIDYNADPLGAGYLPMTAQKWLMASKPIGATNFDILGAPIDRTMPNAANEYVLVNIITKFGWIAGLFLVAVVIMFLVRLFLTVGKVKNRFGFFLSLSACLVLTIKFVFSILMNFNLFPFADLSVPLISYGGADYCVTMALIGIILSVWRRNNIVPAGKRKTGQMKERNKFLSFHDGKLIIDFKKK